MPRSFQVFLNDDDADRFEEKFRASGKRTKQEFLESVIKRFLDGDAA